MNVMTPTPALHDQGQRRWLDNITRDLIRSGTLKRWRCAHSSRRPASMSMRSRPRLQDEGAKAFVKSWQDLMDVVADKSATFAGAR